MWWSRLFSARAQIVVGAVMLVLTFVQWGWWTFRRPSVNAVFQVSMEALLFAAYAVIATGLGYRKTEHVEERVVEGAPPSDSDESGDEPSGSESVLPD